MDKRVIGVIIVVFLLAVGIYQGFFKKEEPAFTLVEVTRGNIAQEISETGQVKKGEEINLSFKNAGKIEKIYVEVGEEVKTGEVLAKLETGELNFQLQEAKAALASVQAQLNKLLAGATPEEIQVAQTKVENNQIALATSKQNLSDAYEDALNTLDNSYLKAYNAFQTVSSIQRTYFVSTDQESIGVKENKTKIESAINQGKSYLDTAKGDAKEENIDIALSEMKNALTTVYSKLGIIREICEEPAYRDKVSSTDKTSLDTHRTNINTALTNVIDSQQSIISKKLAIESAEGQLQTAQDELSLLIASPRQEDIELYQAQVDQAQVQVQILENKIRDANLCSPVNGQVTKIKKRAGELVQPVLQDVTITLLPEDPFEIEVDIYEEDVVKVNLGNSVDISLVAFPEEIFKGKVISIDPAQKEIEGVVYYEVIISPAFGDEGGIPEGIKPGMTADLIIKTASKENVLIVSEDALQKKDGKTIVQVLKDGEIEEKEIKTGLLGSDDMIEVISGLEEGEKIIIP